MTGIYSVTHPLTDSVSDVLRNISFTAKRWFNHSVTAFKAIPANMQVNRTYAITVLTTANVAFFTLTHLAANWLEAKINVKLAEHGEKDLNHYHHAFKHFLLDGVITGGAVLGFNVILSRFLTHYPLTKATLALITASAIALRILLNTLSTEEEVIVEGEPVLNSVNSTLANTTTDTTTATDALPGAQAETVKAALNVEKDQKKLETATQVKDKATTKAVTANLKKEDAEVAANVAETQIEQQKTELQKQHEKAKIAEEKEKIAKKELEKSEQQLKDAKQKIKKEEKTVDAAAKTMNAADEVIQKTAEKLEQDEKVLEDKAAQEAALLAGTVKKNMPSTEVKINADATQTQINAEIDVKKNEVQPQVTVEDITEETKKPVVEVEKTETETVKVEETKTKKTTVDPKKKA